MTQVALAYHSGVAPSEISRFENRRGVPYPGQARRLAKILGLKPDELLEHGLRPVEQSNR